MATAYLRGLPDFVIIGAMKSGTTSLHDFVAKHPAIIPASTKEIQYFSILYKLGELWYRSNFPTVLSKQRFYKKTNKKFLSGEASPTYLFHPMAPSRMKKILTNVKLIVILRNPVDRAYSHYHMNLRHNNEPFSFEKAIEVEKNQLDVERERLLKDPDFVPSPYRTHLYLARGIYADQLENWFRYYSREKFLILTTENFHDNPQQTLDQVFDFLKIAPFQVKNLRNLNVGNYKKMNRNTRSLLIKYFKPHNRRLSELLQRSFDWDK